jgi:hypothetical protein
MRPHIADAASIAVSVSLGAGDSSLLLLYLLFTTAVSALYYCCTYSVGGVQPAWYYSLLLLYLLFTTAVPAVLRLVRLPARQYLHFCTSKASKLSTCCAEAGALARASVFALLYQ